MISSTVFKMGNNRNTMELNDRPVFYTKAENSERIPPLNISIKEDINLIELNPNKINSEVNIEYNDSDEILSKVMQLDVNEFGKYIKKKEN